MKLLLDLRFADDLLLFANTAADAALQLDEIRAALGTVGLILNSANTKMLKQKHLFTSLCKGSWWWKFFVVLKLTNRRDV